MKSPAPELYLAHILESIELAGSYIRGIDYLEFSGNQQLQDAVVRRIEIVGEAVKHLPEELRATASSVPWRQIAGMRDKIVHDYMGIDIGLVWTVVQEEFPKLASEVGAIVARVHADSVIDREDP